MIRNKPTKQPKLKNRICNVGSEVEKETIKGITAIIICKILFIIEEGESVAFY